MFDFIFQMSDKEIFLFLTTVFIGASLLGVWLVKIFLPLHIRYQDDSVIGATSNVISVMFGVLAGLSALYLFNINTATSDAVQREANAVADLYRDCRWIDDPAKTNLKIQIANYLNTVINDDWTKMTMGKDVTTTGDTIIYNFTTQLLALKKQPIKPDDIIMTELLRDVRSMYDARQQRINLSTQSLSPEVWEVLVIGAILTMCINFLFGMNFYLHMVAVAGSGLMVASIMFLLVTLNYPFQGEFIILPTPFQAVLQRIKLENPDNPMIQRAVNSEIQHAS